MDGSLAVDVLGDDRLRMAWTHGSAACAVEVDVATGAVWLIRDGTGTYA